MLIRKSARWLAPRAWGAAALLATTTALAGAPPSDAGAAPPTERSVRPGANREYLTPDLDVQAWSRRFEQDGREAYAQREAIVAFAGARAGAVVGDVGAGTGLFTFLFSRVVGPTGRVYAADLAPSFLAHVKKRAESSGARNVVTVLATDRLPNLPAGALDLVFLCDVYHHLEYPRTTLAALSRALKPGGTLVLVDYRREPGKSAAWILDHVRAGEAIVTAEVQAAGFQLVERSDRLTENYMLKFRHP